MPLEEETVSLNEEPWKEWLNIQDKTPPKQEIALAQTEESVHHLDQLLPLTFTKIHSIIPRVN